MIGLVVMKAEDHRSINKKGNILIIKFNKQINKAKSNKSLPIMSKLDVVMKYQITYGSIMKFRLFRILTIILSFFFLTGFVPILSFVGPGVTVLTSGNIYKASAQFIINQKIEKETGKNSLTLIKETLVEETDKKIKKNSFNEDLRQLVKTRIKMTRQKLDNQNLQKLLKKRIEVTRSILDLNNTTQ